MQLFVEQLLNGIATGSIYALVTLGLALVYGIMRILHVAHAAVYSIGAYVGLLFFNLTGSLLLAVLGSMAVCALVGVSIERFVYFPLLKYPPFVPLIASIAILLSVEGTLSADRRTADPDLPGRAAVSRVSRRRRDGDFHDHCSVLHHCRGSWLALGHHDEKPSWASPCGPLPRTWPSPMRWGSTPI